MPETCLCSRLRPVSRSDSSSLLTVVCLSLSETISVLRHSALLVLCLSRLSGSVSRVLAVHFLLELPPVPDAAGGRGEIYLG